MEKDTVVRESNRVELAGEALALTGELWPRPAYGTVAIETHQWVRLRRLLLEVAEELVSP